MAKLSALFFVLAILISINSAAVLPRVAAPKDELSVSLESEAIFCTFLPSIPWQNIGDSEDTAIPYCTQPTPNAPGAQIFKPGYILSAHIAGTETYVQITGKMDPASGELNSDDDGGQYDSVGAPPGAVCTGYNKFVNLVEPSDGIYCIRCCLNDDDCNTNISTKGCRVVIPGDYS